MSTITLPNIRVSSDLTIRLKLKDGGVAIDWSTLQNIRVSLYADDQRSMASRCSVSIDEEDSTILVCQYAANKMQYLGVNRVIVQCKYMGEVKTYDKPAFNFVRWTSDQEGEQITIDDPDVDVEISVEDVSSSILQEAVDAAFGAADRANDAAAAAEHMVDIHTGPAGKSPYIGENGHWYEWDEETHQYVDTETNAKGDTGETPDISIGTVTTVEPGTPAAASMGGTPEAPVLNLSIPKGAVGATPNFTVGTVTTGQPGTPVVITITGTAEAPVLNVTIPQGLKGDTGVSADYPITIHNGLDSDATDEALAAFQGKVLDGKVSQLEAIVNGNLMSARAKNALMEVFQKVAFTVPDVSDEIAELNNALFNLDELVGIEAVYTQGSTVIWSDGVSSLNDLLPGLVVNAVYGDGTGVPVAYGYTLSGTLTVGTSTITVEYHDFTDTFNVVVTLYGSKMSYVLGDGEAIAYGFALTNSKYRIGSASSTRKHFFLLYGLHKMKNDNGAETQYYPLPIPKNATSVAVTITKSTMKIGGYFMKWDSNSNEYVASGISTQTFEAGGFTKTLEQDGETQLYYVPGIAPASGNIPSGQPTAITIEFSTE